MSSSGFSVLLLFLAIAVIVVALGRSRFRHTRRNRLNIEGKLIWVDKGQHTKPFFNQVFKVLGKPDLMYKQKNGVLAVEYKSRYGKIYLSDIVQAKAAALAARGAGYKVYKILIKTKKTEQYIILQASDRELYSEIKTYVELTRQATKGLPMIAFPHRYKCPSCTYFNTCEKKA